MTVFDLSKLPRSVTEAVTAERDGRPLRYLFFWGHQPPRDGGVGAGCLSQWWEVTFTADGHVFRSAEHYMMAHKAWLFGDDKTAARILAAEHPGEAKSSAARSMASTRPYGTSTVTRSWYVATSPSSASTRS